ncbi:MAG: alpha-E domain-containing protein [Actinomycetota bacterium]
MLSRVADAIYWMTRSIERAENIARIVDVNNNLLLDAPGIAEQWEPLVSTTADLPLFRKHFGEPTRSNVIHFLTFDAANPNSIARCMGTARENARAVRDQISSEMWEQVNTLYHTVRAADGLPAGDALATFLRRVRTEAHRFEGITDATMSRSEGWHFGRLGRMLERADKTSRIIDVKYFILLPDVSEVGTPVDDLQWTAVLKSASAFEMYRKRHGRISPDSVAEFLVLDRGFPRSIQFCLAHAEESLRAISGSAPGTFHNPAEQLLGRLRSMLGYADIGEIIGAGLHEFLDMLQTDMNRVGDAAHDTFFALRPAGATV